MELAPITKADEGVDTGTVETEETSEAELAAEDETKRDMELDVEEGNTETEETEKTNEAELGAEDEIERVLELVVSSA